MNLAVTTGIVLYDRMEKRNEKYMEKKNETKD